ncbi:MAG: hypothetical protein PQJ58_19260 [Spirochaetales bacterium]|nr:hypothetical protein [Spirochaetales bacterium]
MKKSLIFAIIGLAVFIPTLSADSSSPWNFSVGTYMENEMNTDEADKDSDLFISPGVTFGISHDEIPLYMKVEAENRQAGSYYREDTGQRLGHTVRQKLMFGGKFGLGGIAFNPEYELRIHTPAGIGYEGNSYENRFKLNFDFPVSEHNVYLNMMPTYRVNNGKDNTYYHEVETGFRYRFNGTQSFALGLYNELENFDNDGLYNEVQARLYYNHQFSNGINFNPYARIGLYRQYYNGDENVVDTLRQRAGLKMSYSAENGVSPFTEVWYQNTNLKEDQNVNTVMWKVGVSYSF